MSHRAAIVGCGAQGRVISAFLAQDPDFEEVAIFDIEPEYCGGWAGSSEATGKVLRVGRIDAGDSGEVGRAVKGYDVLVNAVLPKYNMSLMKASLIAGANYVDMAFGPPYSNLEAQLALTEAFREAGLTALIGAGMSPGITNLLVAEASDMLDTLVSVRIRMYGEVDAAEPVMTWSPRTFLEDCVIPPSHIAEGQLVHSPPFSGEEEYVFPRAGGRRVWMHEHEESYMFHRTLTRKGLREFDFKMAGLEKIKALYDLGLLRPGEENTIELLASLLPKPPTQHELLEKIRSGVIRGSLGVTVVEVDGLHNGSEARVTMWIENPDILEVVKKYPMATDDSYVVSSACYLFIKTLLQGGLEKGVLMPEELPAETRRNILGMLAKRTPPITLRGRLEKSVALTLRGK